MTVATKSKIGHRVSINVCSVVRNRILLKRHKAAVGGGDLERITIICIINGVTSEKNIH